MPIYEYQCTQCGQIEEALQKLSDPPLTTCRQCKGNMNKLISQSSFHLKGSGWYVTDYGGTSAGSDKAAKGSDSPAKKTESSSCGASCPASKKNE